MFGPTPLLPFRPLDVGSVFSATIQILRTRVGTFLGVSAIGVVAPVLLMAAPLGYLAWMLIEQSTHPQTVTLDVQLAMILAILGSIGAILGGLVQLKGEGVLIETALQVAQGGRPTLAGALRGNRGFVRRLVPFLLLLVLAAVVAYAVLLGGISGLAALSDRGGRGPDGLVALGVIPVALAFWAAVVVLAIRWAYVYQSVALERIGGLAGARRSWGLTRGAFWRTVGYLLMAMLVVWCASIPINMVSQLGMGGAIVRLEMFDFDAESAIRMVAALAPILIGSMVTSMAIQWLSWPFMSVYRTVMYLDQVRRVEHASPFPTTPAHYPPAPQPFTTPGGQPWEPGPPPQHWPPQQPGGVQGWPPAGPSMPTQNWSSPDNRGGTQPPS